MVAIREGERNQQDTTHLFRSYDHVEAAPMEYRAFGAMELNPGTVQRNPTTIWEACRATSAAPLYFKKATVTGVRYMDGGVGVNNPAVLALHEAKQMAQRQNQKEAIAALISIGTGHRSAQSRFTNLFALLKWLKMTISDPQKAHEDVQKQLKNDKNYFRFDVQPPERSDDAGLNKMRLDECKWKKQKSKDKKRTKGKVSDASYQNGTISNNTHVSCSDKARSSTQTTIRQGQLKKEYNPEKFEYKTYDKIKTLTYQYCEHSQQSHQVSNIDGKLELAAEILVHYRRRRERESEGDRWTRFSEHPYETYINTIKSVPRHEP